ncbi:MAG TPA: DMT family transporter [Dongiaceae bacterium]|jgi:drug/metabolite transporter (DMT)-like permease|nr:DMT family transporter [Dongiaceae bacterium]
MIFPRVPLLVLQIGLVLAWSSGYVGAIIAADTGSIVRVLLWRFVCVALLFLPFLLNALRRGIVTWRWCLLHGLLGAVGMFACVGLGIESINLGLPAGTGALISALQPLAAAVLAGPILRERVSRAQWIGLAVGFVGVGSSVGGLSGGDQLLGYLCSFGSMACMVAATLIAKAKWPGDDFLPALAFQTLVAAILFVPVAAYEGVLPPEPSWHFAVAVAWAVVFSTLGGYGFYYLCLMRAGTVRTSSLIYLTPPVTLVWAWLMFGQPMSLYTVAGLVLCLVGVALARGERSALPRLSAEKA